MSYYVTAEDKKVLADQALLFAVVWVVDVAIPLKWVLL